MCIRTMVSSSTAPVCWWSRRGLFVADDDESNEGPLTNDDVSDGPPGALRGRLGGGPVKTCSLEILSSSPNLREGLLDQPRKRCVGLPSHS